MPKRQRPYDPSHSLETAEQILGLLAQVEAHIDDILGPVRQDLEQIVLGLHDKQFDSYEANRAVADAIQWTLGRLGLRAKCPREGCGRPAILRCFKATGMRNGVFQFEHCVQGRRTRHLGPSRLQRFEFVRLSAGSELKPLRVKKR